MFVPPTISVRISVKRSWQPRTYNIRRDERIRLQHILDAIDAAQSFIVERVRDDLDTDLQLQFALVRAIEIIGAAA